ncbi:ubiE/COQ5 methyltransferase, putative, partial [Hepatocystis sp. ex Piliocolobus tephrosceles]
LYNFGFQKVTENIKSKLIHNLFSNVSNKYDIMNDLMSLGIHRIWKTQLVNELDLYLKYHSQNLHEEVYKNEILIKEQEVIDTSHKYDEKVLNEEKEQINSIDNEQYETNEEDICLTMEQKNNLNNSNNKILDLAGGTGDIAFRIIEKYIYFLKIYKTNNTYCYIDDIIYKKYEQYIPRLIVCDINKDMMEVGKKRAIELDYNKYIMWLNDSAENLKSIKTNSIDIVTLSFGIRNFTDISKALKEIYRVLKPGGRFLCLEFCKPTYEIVKPAYTFYLNQCIPILGMIVANSKDSYKYLAESIQTFLTPEELARLMFEHKFINVTYTTMTFDVVAIHSGYKLSST